MGKGNQNQGWQQRSSTIRRKDKRKITLVKCPNLMSRTIILKLYINLLSNCVIIGYSKTIQDTVKLEFFEIW